MYSVIIPAAGTGARMRMGYNKLLHKISNHTIIEHTVDKFLNDSKCKQIVVSVSTDDVKKMSAIFKNDVRLLLVIGGRTRQDSIYNALKIVTQEVVLVHDGARPFVTGQIINACYDVAVQGLGAIAAIRLKDTIKQRDRLSRDVVNKTIPRDELIIAQTPQAFPTDVLRKAYELALNAGYTGTDDASLVEKFTKSKIKIVDGDYKNVKFTTSEDVEYFEFLMKKR